MKKKLLLVVGLGIASFVGGLAGFYAMMPALAPGLVEQTRIELDSLGLLAYDAADSLRSAREATAGYTPAVPGGTTPAALAAHVSTAAATPSAGGVDSLKLALLDQVRAVEAERSALKRQVETLTARLEAIEGRRAEAESVSATLAKLDDRQLGGILQNLDPVVLEMIYRKSPAKTQARLLAALPGDRAAGFLRSLMGVKASEPVAPATPPATTASTTGSSER